MERRFSITKKSHRNPNHGSAKVELSEKLLQTYGEQKCGFEDSTTTALEKQKVRTVTCNLCRLVMFSLGVI